MRKFGKTKIQNETVKQSTSEPVKEIRHILKQSIPIEDVILFSDAEHTEGTSRYWFNFPSTWRTITNQNLILGVRSISLVNEIPQVAKFDIRFVIAHNINQTGDNQKIIQLNASFDIDLKFNQGYTLLKRITDNLNVSYILTANMKEDPLCFRLTLLMNLLLIALALGFMLKMFQRINTSKYCITSKEIILINCIQSGIMRNMTLLYRNREKTSLLSLWCLTQTPYMLKIFI